MNTNWFLQLVTLELFQTTNLSEGLPAPLVYEKERLIEAMLILLKFIQLRVVVFFETPTRIQNLHWVWELMGSWNQNNVEEILMLFLTICTQSGNFWMNNWNVFVPPGPWSSFGH